MDYAQWDGKGGFLRQSICTHTSSASCDPIQTFQKEAHLHITQPQRLGSRAILVLVLLVVSHGA